MRKLKRSIILLLLVMLGSFFMGCDLFSGDSKENKISPEETTEVILNYIIKGEEEKLDNVTKNPDEFRDFKDKYESSFIKGFTMSLSSDIKENITEDMKEDIYMAFVKGLSKVEYTTEVISEDEETAKVKVNIKALNLVEARDEALFRFQEEMQDNYDITKEEAVKLIFDIMEEELEKGPLSAEEKEVTLKFQKKKGLWELDDFSQIGDIAEGMAIVG